MAKALFIPGADRTSRWFGDAFDGLIQGELDKLVLHSTETNKRWGCPPYEAGGTAPTVTINPWRGYQKTWQHFQANESARALLNPSTTPVSENKDKVAQVEIIGYSDVKLGKAAGCYLPDLADDELTYVANIVRWYHEEWGIQLVAPPLWPLYQVSSEKAFADARMTSTEYDRFAGVLAHLHVSGNAHRDVAIDITKLLALAGGEDFDMASIIDFWTTKLTKKGTTLGKGPGGQAEENEAPIDILTRMARNLETVAGLQRAEASADQVAAAVLAKLPAGQSIDEATMARAFVTALRELAAGSETQS